VKVLVQGIRNLMGDAMREVNYLSVCYWRGTERGKLYSRFKKSPAEGQLERAENL